MKILKLQITNFRCIKRAKLNFSTVNIFHGDNGQGKTSLLEAINLLAFTQSHRTNVSKECIQDGCDYLVSEAEVQKFNTLNTLKITLTTTAKKKVVANNSPVVKLSNYIGHLCVVLVSSDDIQLIKGGPSVRRKFLNKEISQVTKQYIDNALIYNKLLKQRNELLKNYENCDEKLFDIVSDRLIHYGVKIMDERQRFILLINQIAKDIYYKLSESKDLLEIKYLANSKSDYKEKMISKINIDINNNCTMHGPHRDDISIEVAGRRVSVYSSQGEQRTVLLAIKLALVQLIQQKTNSCPILLLDDVVGDLDNKHMLGLFASIPRNVQTFITTTDLSKIQYDNEAKVFSVKEGDFYERDTY